MGSLSPVRVELWCMVYWVHEVTFGAQRHVACTRNCHGSELSRDLPMSPSSSAPVQMKPWVIVMSALFRFANNKSCLCSPTINGSCPVIIQPLFLSFWPFKAILLTEPQRFFWRIWPVNYYFEKGMYTIYIEVWKSKYID